MNIKFKGRLDKAEVYKDELGIYWLRLEYVYKEGRNIHRVVFPKVDLHIPESNPMIEKEFAPELPCKVKGFISSNEFEKMHQIFKDKEDRLYYVEVEEIKQNNIKPDCFVPWTKHTNDSEGDVIKDCTYDEMKKTVIKMLDDAKQNGIDAPQAMGTIGLLCYTCGEIFGQNRKNKEGSNDGR